MCFCRSPNSPTNLSSLTNTHTHTPVSAPGGYSVRQCRRPASRAWAAAAAAAAAVAAATIEDELVEGGGDEEGTGGVAGGSNILLLLGVLAPPPPRSSSRCCWRFTTPFATASPAS